MQIGIVGLDGQIELEALRLYGLPEGAPALLTGTPALPVGQREFAVETTLDLPSLAGRAVEFRHCRVEAGLLGQDGTQALLLALGGAGSAVGHPGVHCVSAWHDHSLCLGQPAKRIRRSIRCSFPAAAITS